MLVFLGWRSYSRNTLVRTMSCRSRLIMKRRRRKTSHMIIAWWFSCCSWFHAPFSTVRATNTLRWYGLKECRISAGCMSGYGVGCDRLISTTSFMRLSTPRRSPLADTCLSWGSNLICCILYYKRVFKNVYVYKCVDVYKCICRNKFVCLYL